MGKAILSDMRKRMVSGIASGKYRRAVAAQFEVAPSTAVRIQARFAATGSVEPAKQGRPKGSGKLGPYRHAILAKVEGRPKNHLSRLTDANHAWGTRPQSRLDSKGRRNTSIFWQRWSVRYGPSRAYLFHGQAEGRDLGSLAARGVDEFDRSSVRSPFVLDLSAAGAHGRHPAG